MAGADLTHCTADSSLSTCARILVVDSDAGMRRHVTHLLAEHYRVEAAADREAALCMIQARRPDLIICDVMFSKLDGLSLDTQTIPIIFLCDSHAEGLEHGAADFLFKPFNANELLARVRNHFHMASVRLRPSQAQVSLEEELQLILDTAPVMIWYKDTRNRIIRVNKMAADSLGLPKDRIQGRDAAEFYVDADRYFKDDLIVIETGRSRLGIVEPYQLVGGDRRWVQTDKVPMKDGRGTVIGILVIAQDITERKQAENALRESEERLSAILNRAPAAIFIKDPAGRYLFMNEQCARVLRLNREQVYGCTDRDLLSPELAAQFMANDQRVWESGRLATVEEQIPQADGVHISLVQKFLLRDSQGKPYALSGIALDITSHLRLEAAIQASEARLQLAQSAANIGVFDWDITAQKAVWSPELERIWGLPAGGFDGSADAWRRLVHPDDLALAYAGTQRSLENPTSASEFEYRIVRPDGAVRWIYAKAKTLCNQEGRAVRVVGVNLDITERKEAQLCLERSAEELERQVAERTRELLRSEDRLRAMVTDLTLTEQRERKRLATELHDHLQQILVLGKLTIGQGKRVAAGGSSSEEILEKVDDIFSDALTYTRTLVSDLSPSVLRDHGLAAALRWLGLYMQKHGLTVTVTVLEDQELTLPEDQVTLLFQSVRELLINSVKYAGTGEATLTMEQGEGNLCITVSDEGKGFDPEAAAGTPSGGMSSKFGLYSIQERMRALGGSFDIHSVPGKGTTAMLVVPLARKTDDTGLNLQVAATRDSSGLGLSPSTAAPQQTITVLLVDDHLMVRQGLRAVLDAYADVEVVGEAGNGEEAVRLADQLRPSVVVMDINMPTMNGIEATRQIMQRYPETIIMGLSVNATQDNEEAMKRAGAITLMTKEAAVEQLHDAIQEAVKSA